MNPYTLRSTVVAAGVGAILLGGCSPRAQTETPAASSRGTPAAAAPNADSEHSEPAVTVTPAGTVAGIWAQVGAEQARLSTAIENGQLKDVHPLAFGIRDLVVALADKAGAASPATADRLKGLVEQVRVSATKLDEFGDAGNLSGTQAESVKLQTVLDTIQTVTAAK